MFLDWLRDVVSPIEREDPVFGRARFVRDAGFWEANLLFNPLGRNVEVLIRGTSEGPSEEQYRFFRNVEARYALLFPTIQDRLRQEAAKLEIPRVSFELASIAVPATLSERSEWELGYESSPPGWHFTVLFRGWQATEVVAEC